MPSSRKSSLTWACLLTDGEEFLLKSAERNGRLRSSSWLPAVKGIWMFLADHEGCIHDVRMNCRKLEAILSARTIRHFHGNGEEGEF